MWGSQIQVLWKGSSWTDKKVKCAGAFLEEGSAERSQRAWHLNGWNTDQVSSIKDKSWLMCVVRRQASGKQVSFPITTHLLIVSELGFNVHILWFAYKILLLYLEMWKRGKSRNIFFTLRTMKCLRGRGIVLSILLPSLLFIHLITKTHLVLDDL